VEHRPEEVNSHSGGQEILCLLWNWEVHYCVHQSLPLIPMLNLCVLPHTHHAKTVTISS